MVTEVAGVLFPSSLHFSTIITSAAETSRTLSTQRWPCHLTHKSSL